MALLFLPHHFQDTGTRTFHHPQLVPRQFLETCADWSRRDKETCRALVSSLAVEGAANTLQACEKPTMTLLPSIPPLPPALVFLLFNIHPTQISTTFHPGEQRGVGQVLPPQSQTKKIPLMHELWRSCSPLPPLQYAQGPLLDNLYWTKWYNNESLAAHSTQSYIYYENLLLGVPRMRQLKVKNNSCVVHDDFKEEISSCYDVYSEEKEERVSFGLVNGTA